MVLVSRGHIERPSQQLLSCCSWAWDFGAWGDVKVKVKGLGFEKSIQMQMIPGMELLNLHFNSHRGAEEQAARKAK